MEKNMNIDLPMVIVDLTNDDTTVYEDIARCEEARQAAKPWYKRITKRFKSWFKK